MAYQSNISRSDKVNQVDEKQKVLFICSSNSARSQMGEGLLRFLYPDRYESYSAGVQASTVNPYAIRVMEELGVDMSAHRSKSVEEFRQMKFDTVVTVCDRAKETCPFFPGAKEYRHKNFDNPSEAQGTEDEILTVFRRVRDEIRDWIEKTFGAEGE
jgi:arsenate reductase